MFGAQCGSDDGEHLAGAIALEDTQGVLAAVALLAPFLGELALIDAGVQRVEFGTPHGLTDAAGVELLGRRVLPMLDRRG